MFFHLALSHLLEIKHVVFHKNVSKSFNSNTKKITIITADLALTSIRAAGGSFYDIQRNIMIFFQQNFLDENIRDI